MLHPRARALAIVSCAITVASTAACSGSREQQHATDRDTGAAAPATVIDMSATPRAGDSTAGVAKATGQPQNAGDTTGARARDKSPGPKGGKPTMP